VAVRRWCWQSYKRGFVAWLAQAGQQIAPLANRELTPHAAKRVVAEVRQYDDAADQHEQNGQFRVHRFIPSHFHRKVVLRRPTGWRWPMPVALQQALHS
jgi:hypothetical protein